MGRIDTFNRLAAISWGMTRRGSKLGLIADVLWERLRYGTELQDYFQYEFFKLKNCERRRYMTFTKLRHTMKVCNDPSKRDIFDDKVMFNRTFAEYIHRDWIDATTATFDEFQMFIAKHPTFFVKARSGMFGINAGKYDIAMDASVEKKKEVYEELKTNGCLVEQLIDQHIELASFNPSSVNTLRIVTLLCADGNPKVMAGVLRIGRAGKTVDNFHYYGIAVTIDVDKGIVNAPGIDREFKRYLVHPDSGKQIIGFNIPGWDKATYLVRQAAMVIPEVRYVGWDVAIDSDGNTQLIEGNYGADPDVTQMPCREGKWPAFRNELALIKERRP